MSRPRVLHPTCAPCSSSWIPKGPFSRGRSCGSSDSSSTRRATPTRGFERAERKRRASRGSWAISSLFPRSTASSDLARIRRSIQTLRERLAQRLESILRDLGIAESFVTLREGRYAIAVPASSRRQVPGVALGYSGSGATVFLEPREAAEANSQLADLFVDEVREVNRILRELSGLARRDREALARNLDR